MAYPTSYRESPGLIPSRSTRYLGWRKCHWGKLFFSRGFLVIIIPPKLNTHLHLYIALIKRIKGRSLGNFQKSMLFRKSGSTENERTFLSLNGKINPKNVLTTREIIQTRVQHFQMESDFLLPKRKSQIM
jgi:hypothetical protein